MYIPSGLRALCLIIALAAVLCFFTGSNGAGAFFIHTADIEDTEPPLASAGTKICEPFAPGTVTYGANGARIDASNASEGYIMVKCSGSPSRLKVQIAKNGNGTTYTYDLNTAGIYEVFPLTAGKGSYTVNVFRNESGTKYIQLMSASVEADISDSLRPFLYPNQYVNFNADCEAVKKSESLAADKKDRLSVVAAVYKYVTSNITYDTLKAEKAKAGRLSGYISDVDSTLKSQKGICLDFAALMTAMLRAQGIPTRLEVGYVAAGTSTAYHAWISTYIEDEGWIDNIIYFDGKSWKLMDPTFAAGGNSGYIGSGSNYSTVYIY